jgi:hypothetical protein
VAEGLFVMGRWLLTGGMILLGASGALFGPIALAGLLHGLLWPVGDSSDRFTRWYSSASRLNGSSGRPPTSGGD